MTDITREALTQALERGDKYAMRVVMLRDALDKAERERDDYAQAARVEASARRRFMQERDEALEVLRWYADANNHKSPGPNSYPSPVYFDAGDRARAILAKHEVKP